MERDTQAQEPTPTSQAAATDEMTDEQLEQVAGGIIGSELDSGYKKKTTYDDPPPPPPPT
jgi:hypothetical protein